MSSWQLVKLGTITTKVGSGATPRGGKDSYKAAGVPLIRSQNVHFDGFRDDGLAFLDDDQAEALRSVEVHAEDVLLNITGASIGRVTTAPTRMYGARVNQHVCIIRPKPELRPSFLSWYLASPNIQHFIFDIQTGVTRQALTKEQILAFDVPLPSVDTQDKIVAEIEKQFSRLDEAVTALKRIQANLKRYKAAVLKAAVEGKLTEQWRKEHPDVEPADQLLKRILSERRTKWEAEELSKMKAKGIKPKDDSWKKKYKEPAGPNTANLPGSPARWVWANLQQVFKTITDGDHQPPPQTETGIPFLVIGNVRRGRIDFSDTRFVSADYYSAIGEERTPRKNDILYTLVGSYGIAVLIEDEQKFCIQRHIGILKPSDRTNIRFFKHILNSNFIYRQATSIATGTAQLTVPLGGLRMVVVPLPPVSEQLAILEEIDRRLSVTEALETTIETNLKRTERLRQTILHRVFSGVSLK